MANKITKGLWIPAELAAEFDREVQRLARLMPDKLEAGLVGAAAMLTFLRLPSDKAKLEAIRAARNYAIDRALKRLPRGDLATAEDADRLVDDASSSTGARRADTKTPRKKRAEG